MFESMAGCVNKAIHNAITASTRKIKGEELI